MCSTLGVTNWNADGDQEGDGKSIKEASGHCQNTSVAVGLGTLTFLFRTGQPQMLNRCTYRNSCKQTVEVFQQRQTAYFRKNSWMLKLNRLEFHPALPLASWKILGDFLPWVSQLQEADLIVYGKFSTVHNDAHIMVNGCWMLRCEMGLMAEGN